MSYFCKIKFISAKINLTNKRYDLSPQCTEKENVRKFIYGIQSLSLSNKFYLCEMKFISGNKLYIPHT